MHRNPEPAGRVLTEQLGVGEAMPAVVYWPDERVSPVATATTIQYQTAKQVWSIC